MPSPKIQEATGASVRPDMLQKNKFFPVTDFGAAESAQPTVNTAAFNRAIKAAAAAGGGTVMVPKGTFLTYTILLQSNVNLFLEEGAVVAAARTDILHSYEKQNGEGGNYAEPEVNPYLGLQDHGHSYFANSLVYGADLENIMIYGNGLFTGGRFDETTGLLEYVLQGGDPMEPVDRKDKGHRGEWFGNKGLALVRCKNIVFQDFSVTIGGHFAIITEGCENLYVNNILVDTTRDAFDIDCCKDVTVRNTVCNSLTDDGLCLKASFGAGIFKPLENVLIEDCEVSGYDAGSVYAGEYTRDKLIALDRCGPTGRVKFGTEATCGYHRVTIRRVRFDRSRGFCMEATDCSSLTDVIFEDCLLDNISSSPIFIRAGERGRFPVTGIGKDITFPAANDVRLDNAGWILPNTGEYHCYPVKRYAPHYNRTKTVTVDGCSSFEIVDEANPALCNSANFTERDGHFYRRRWDESTRSYVSDFSKEIPAADLALYANGIGCADMATVANVRISNVKITNADPRYPILLMGLTDSHLKNIVLEHIQVEYRGGLTMEHAVEQRQLNTEWKFSQFHAKEHVQNLPWLVNTFFLKNEGLLPRADWDASTGSWKNDPYNIPELPEVYPEPSNWGILPAYGIFAKHVDGLTLKDIKISCKVPDERHVCVFDDINGVTLDGLEADCAEGREPIAVITDRFRRHTNAENVPEQPYFTTGVEGLEFVQPVTLHTPSGRTKTTDTGIVREVEINAPAPGTPRDSLYSHPTVPCKDTGYTFPVATDDYPLPLTVHRPFIRPMAPVRLPVGENCRFTLAVRNPATDISDEADNGILYNEQAARLNYSVKGASVVLTLSCENLPRGACFNAESGEFFWTPSADQIGEYAVTFAVDDGVIPEKMTVSITVE